MSITTQTKAANRFESIDSFRGIAALLVVLYHLSGSLEKQLGLLYLLHPDFGWKTIAVLERLLPIKNSPLLTLMIFAMGIVASIISAHVVHKFIEAPSQRLSKKFSMQKAF